MKSLTLTFSFFFLFFTFSQSQGLEFLDLSQDLFPINPDHHQGSVSSSVDRATQDDILFSDLITKSSQVQPVEVKEETENKPALDVTRLDLRYFGKNRKFPFSRTFRFVPRRCQHNKPDRRFVQWGPASEMDQNVVQFMYKKDNKEKDRVVPRGIDGPHSEILQHRHVARKFPEAGEMMMINRPHFIDQIPRPHDHHHDHHHDHDEKEFSDDEKEFSDDEKEEDKHDEKEFSDDEKDHDDHDGVKEGRNGVINKIRNFLNYF